MLYFLPSLKPTPQMDTNGFPLCLNNVGCCLLSNKSKVSCNSFQSSSRYATSSGVHPLRSYMMLIALSYFFADFRALDSTLLKWRFPDGFAGLISATKRCICTPSNPYSFIHLKCKSTLSSSYGLYK